MKHNSKNLTSKAQASLGGLSRSTQVRLYVVGSAVAGIVPFYDVPIARGLVVGCESQQCSSKHAR